MKLFIFIFLSLISTTRFAQAKGYPFVAAINGKILFDGKPASLWNFVGEHKKIELTQGSTARIEVSPHQILILTDSAQVKLGPWDHKSQSYDWYLLENGSARVVNKSQDTFILKTDFTEFNLKDIDVVFQLRLERYELKAIALLGELEFKGFGRDDSANLKPGLSSYFVAEYEAGEALFDYLLKGKKSARGKLTQPIEVSEADLKDLKLKYWLDKIDLKKIEALKYQTRRADQICDKPFVAFNECVFVKENNKCYRRRCNANGEWAEKTLVPDSLVVNCSGAKPNVQKCGDF